MGVGCGIYDHGRDRSSTIILNQLFKLKRHTNAAIILIIKREKIQSDDDAMCLLRSMFSKSNNNQLTNGAWAVVYRELIN